MVLGRYSADIVTHHEPQAFSVTSLKHIVHLNCQMHMPLDLGIKKSTNPLLALKENKDINSQHVLIEFK